MVPHGNIMRVVGVVGVVDGVWVVGVVEVVDGVGVVGVVGVMDGVRVIGVMRVVRVMERLSPSEDKRSIEE